MAIEEILRDIEEKGKIQIDNIRKDTEEKVTRIINDAMERAKNLLEEAKKNITKQLDYERKRVISTVNMEMKIQYHRTLNDIIDKSVEEIKRILISLRNTEYYSDYIKMSIKKGKEDLGEDAIIIISEKDRDLIKEEKNIKISKDLESLGGVIIEARDGKKRADYSINTILNEKILQIKQEIYDKIKGEL